MFESIAEMEDLPDELIGTPFERLIIMALKEFGKVIRNLEGRIEILEKKLKKIGGK